MNGPALHLFKDSRASMLSLLDDNRISYATQRARPGAVLAGPPEVLELLPSAAMWGALATVICAFLKARHSRKVIITRADRTIIHAEGLTPAELERLLPLAQSITAIDTQPADDQPPT